MEESLTFESTSDGKNDSILDEQSSLFPISQRESSIFEENSPANDSFIKFPIDDVESFSQEIEEENQDRYFVNNSRLNESENENNTLKKSNLRYGSGVSSCSSNTHLFKTSNVLFINSSKKFSGRKRKMPIVDGSDEQTHNKYSEDNVKRKIQIHVMNSITQYMNEILNKIDIGLEHIPVFNKINYSIKKNITNKTFEENKNKTLENLLENEISSKYKKFSIDSNKKGIEKIKNNEIIKSILSQKYQDYFREIYYQNERRIDLSKFGLKKIIKLSNEVKLYEDIFTNKVVNMEYRNRIEEIIRKKFLI